MHRSNHRCHRYETSLSESLHSPAFIKTRIISKISSRHQFTHKPFFFHHRKKNPTDSTGSNSYKVHPTIEKFPFFCYFILCEKLSYFTFYFTKASLQKLQFFISAQTHSKKDYWIAFLGPLGTKTNLKPMLIFLNIIPINK